MSCLHQLRQLLDGQIDEIPRCRLCRIHKREGRMETPEHFWSLGIPDTQQCKARGRSISYRLTNQLNGPNTQSAVFFRLRHWRSDETVEISTKTSLKNARRWQGMKPCDVKTVENVLFKSINCCTMRSTQSNKYSWFSCVQLKLFYMIIFTILGI